MTPSLEQILHSDQFSEAELAAIRDAVRVDPVLAGALADWANLARRVSDELNQIIPSRDVLVLLALKDRIGEQDLSNEEQSALTAASSKLEHILVSHPSVSRILDRIRDEATAFDTAWESTLGARTDRPAEPRRRSTMRLVRLAVSAAAVVALIAIGVQQFNAQPPMADHHFVTAAGEMQTITLDDGTTVRMHPESSVSWEGDFNRKLSFDGAAFFDVKASPNPFVIETDGGVTTVLGTSFGVRTRPGAQTEVTLVSGRVSVESADGSSGAIIMEPGDQSIISPEGVSNSRVDLLEALSWSKLIVFRDTNMKKVAKTLSERFDVRITVSADLEKTPLTGTFDQERGISAIMDIIAAALGADVEVAEDGSSYYLSR